ncbi:hypothetical protein CC86DRAFT_118560 [Ophiobolus disseminans]|uniref:Uncharacterized protein n=1 Tax=Ophiobolus disseminans TaxID=1469910 RepID=A0A6A6ZHM3_9PLEO|nr:hypothetical protein CC86DRAFT_118560 [Ophiobolus disseminans]
MDSQSRRRFVLRFRLLQSVMPLFAEAAYQKQKTAKRLSSLRAFGTAVLTPCLFLDLEVCDPTLLSQQGENLLKEALECLQLIVQENVPEKEHVRAQFPLLETIRSRLRTTTVEELALEMICTEPTDPGRRS